MESGSAEKAVETALALRQDQLVLDLLKLASRRDNQCRILTDIPEERHELRNDIVDYLIQCAGNTAGNDETIDDEKTDSIRMRVPGWFH